MPTHSNSTYSVENSTNDLDALHFRNAELAMIGGLKQIPKWIKPLSANIISEKDFYCNDTREIFIAMKKLSEENPNFDIFQLTESMQANSTWKDEHGKVLGEANARLSDADPSNAVSHAVNLRQRSLLIEMEKACRQKRWGDILPLSIKLAKLDEIKKGDYTPENICFVDPTLPLQREVEPAAEFPVNALGKTLEKAADGISILADCKTSLAAPAVLASAAAAAQGVGNVENIFGDHSPTPLNTFFIALASSGDRKTTVMNYAMKPHKIYSKKLVKSFADRQGLAGGGYVNEGAYIASDLTIEGLILALKENPSMLVENSEGGFLHGYGFEKEQRYKTVKGFSELWDAGMISRRRAGGSLTLYDRRVSMCLMSQPEMMGPILNDQKLAAQGFFNRCLINQPESQIIPTERFSKGERVHFRDMLLEPFYQAVNALLEAQQYSESGDLQLRELTLSAPAHELATDFLYELWPKIEKEYEPIAGWVKKAVEHATRLAGITMLADNPDATEIDSEHMAGGITLARYYMDEALRLKNSSQGGPDEEKLSKADKLYHWLTDTDKTGSKYVDSKGVFSLPDIYVFGPSCRSKKTALSLLDELQEHGYVEQVDISDKKYRRLWRIRSPNAPKGQAQPLYPPVGGDNLIEYEERLAKQNEKDVNVFPIFPRSPEAIVNSVDDSPQVSPPLDKVPDNLQLVDNDALLQDADLPPPNYDATKNDVVEFESQSIINAVILPSSDEHQPNYEDAGSFIDDSLVDDYTAVNDLSSTGENSELASPVNHDDATDGGELEAPFDNHDETILPETNQLEVEVSPPAQNDPEAPLKLLSFDGFYERLAHKKDGFLYDELITEAFDNGVGFCWHDSELLKPKSDGDVFLADLDGFEDGRDDGKQDETSRPDNDIQEHPFGVAPDMNVPLDTHPPFSISGPFVYYDMMNELSVADLKKICEERGIFQGKPEATDKHNLISRIIDWQDGKQQHPSVVKQDVGQVEPKFFNYDKQSVPILKGYCRNKGLPLRGKKADLIARLEKHNQEERERGVNLPSDEPAVSKESVATDEKPKYTFKKLDKLTKKKLTEICIQHGLRVGESKIQLISNILAWQEGNGSQANEYDRKYESLKFKTNDELRELCKKNNIRPISGNKDVLISRLLNVVA